ncbi:hypothetical protein [Alysiella filiformis]|uniref:GAF domain-containing protein n=1 Tax=Alysiella filiformis DSM 16848 TaxID=1120981 RepID=A0A286ES02_9NEIS|nr:hypothetical protein [Alysiella filiformis]QMT31974.1 hypothetical protein H3L97_03610 [Alysiella filiformis]UBQ57118.1 hypothetical protein JF568_05065 [Alysiella filiformis DSM 16848]SOD73721.1 hypothetical protein SAMN02746062_02282 [Alysiella filiformis DSM 16848]
MTQQSQIQDYLQTQALKLNADDVAIAFAATQAVLQHAQAHIDDAIIAYPTLPETWRTQMILLKRLFMAMDSVYSRHAVQTVAAYGWLPETAQLQRLVQMGAPIEDTLPLNAHTVWQHLPCRTAQSGWANVADNVVNWLDLGELQGEHNRRAHTQISLPICGENGTVYGVLHLEHSAMLPENALADWVGFILAILPIVRELCPQNQDNNDDEN